MKIGILDPRGPFLQKWNKIFVWSCVLAISIDPLFFYIPLIDDDKKCLGLDQKLLIAAIVLRSFSDIFYIIHIIFQFRTGFIAPSSQVFGRGVLVKDALEIARRYLSSHFLIDILAVLPLPQAVVLLVIPLMGGSRSLDTMNLLKLVVLFQYVPRVLRVHPLYKEATITSGIFTKTAWSGAALNLLLYMLAGHVLGAFWYLFSIERETTCWKKACGNRTECVNYSVYCNHSTGFKAFLNESCSIETPNAALFDFGIFLGALQSGVVGSTNYPEKFFYCFWWGLQNLSSLGQNLKTSTFVWEIFFSVFVCIAGLVLFSLLIGNMQKYLLQSTATRLEEWRVKMRDAEQWMSTRLLPANLRERIRRYEQYKWQKTRGVDEENLIRNLPKDLGRDIKRHLGLHQLKRVPVFVDLDEQWLDALCGRLEQVLYTEDSYIIREGDPVDEMLFVMCGKLLTVTTNGCRTDFFNLDHLKDGDFCGEELLAWALDPHSSTNLPISTRTVQAVSEVEAFVLKADDLKFMASKFNWLHNQQLRHKFRFYSHQWRMWAACYIQAAWRRYSRKKREVSLTREENRSRGASVEGWENMQVRPCMYRIVDPMDDWWSRNLPMIPDKPTEPDVGAEGPKMASFGSQGTPSRCSPRAKGKDKAGNQSRARQQLQLDERACWTPAITEAFLQCCADDIDNFGRVSTSLDKQAWLRVVDDFNKRTNSNLQITQLKNRWDQLKRDWGAWRMLTEDRSVTGIGWDPKKKTVTGPDHWWATMILRNKLVAKFKVAGLGHADLMERVFRDVTATGAGAYVPRSRQERMAEVESDDSHELQSDGTNAVQSPDPFGPAVAKRFKLGSGGSGTQSYKSRVAASTSAMSESINELIQTVKTSEHRVVTHDAGRDLHIEAIKKLSSLPIFKDENNHEVHELHWWAIRLFEKTGKVDAFLGFNSDVGCQTWLYYEHRAALNAYQRGHSRDEAIPPPYFPPPPYDP